MRTVEEKSKMRRHVYRLTRPVRLAIADQAFAYAGMCRGAEYERAYRVGHDAIQRAMRSDADHPVYVSETQAARIADDAMINQE